MKRWLVRIAGAASEASDTVRTLARCRRRWAWAVLGVFVAFAPFSSVRADAIRCDGGIVNIGAREHEVLRACGEPDYQEPLREIYLYGHILLRSESRWFYNFGPRRLIRILQFHDGRLQSVRTGGYGFVPAPGRRCQPSEIQPGISGMELLERCGQPLERQTRTRVRQPYLDPPRHVLVTHEEEWIYEFGPRNFDRIAVLVGGEVVRVERGSRG